MKETTISVCIVVLKIVNDIKKYTTTSSDVKILKWHPERDSNPRHTA